MGADNCPHPCPSRNLIETLERDRHSGGPPGHRRIDATASNRGTRFLEWGESPGIGAARASPVTEGRACPGPNPSANPVGGKDEGRACPVTTHNHGYPLRRRRGRHSTGDQIASLSPSLGRGSRIGATRRRGTGIARPAAVILAAATLAFAIVPASPAAADAAVSTAVAPAAPAPANPVLPAAPASADAAKQAWIDAARRAETYNEQVLAAQSVVDAAKATAAAKAA